MPTSHVLENEKRIKNLILAAKKEKNVQQEIELLRILINTRSIILELKKSND